MLRVVNPRLFDCEPMRRCCLNECRAACCLYGVWIDRDQAQELLALADRIRPHMAPERRDPAGWFDGREEPDPVLPSGWAWHSRVVEDPGHYGGTSCVFLRPDHKCALQVASVFAGEHPWRYKPFYCVLHPLDLDGENRITLDETGLLLEEKGSCLRPAEERTPLLEIFEPELRHLLGEEEYRRLLEARTAGQPGGGR
jgi:hypothetical protein